MGLRHGCSVLVDSIAWSQGVVSFKVAVARRDEILPVSFKEPFLEGCWVSSWGVMSVMRQALLGECVPVCCGVVEVPVYGWVSRLWVGRAARSRVPR